MLYIQLEFGWHRSKNETNINKHGSDFEMAQLDLDDPYHIAFIERVTDGEERWQAIRSSEEIAVVVVGSHVPSDAVIGGFYRPQKTAVTICLDSDVLAWLKSEGEGYQTRINL